MHFLLSFFIFLTTSTITYSGGTLSIVNEKTVSPSDVSSYKECTKLEIESSEAVSIADDTFKDFSDLKTIVISVIDISIKASSFQNCKAIEKLVFYNTNLTNLERDTFTNPIKTLEYNGDNFNFYLYSQFLAQKVEQFTINVTNNCTITRDDYFSKSITDLKIYATNVIMMNYSFSFPTLKSLTIKAADSIYALDYSFQTSSIQYVDFKAEKLIELGTRVFNSCSPETTSIRLSSNGIINIGLAAFVNTRADELEISAVGNVTIKRKLCDGSRPYYARIKSSKGSVIIGDQSFTNSYSFRVYLSSEGDMIIGGRKDDDDDDEEKEEKTVKSLLYSDPIKEFEFNCRGNIFLNDGAFVNLNADQINMFTKKDIYFGGNSFGSSQIDEFYIRDPGSITFAGSSFTTHTRIQDFLISTNENITFEEGSFSKSYIQRLEIKKIENQEVPEGRTITFEKEAFKGCETLNEIDLRVYGTVYIDERAFQNNKRLSRVYITAREKVHVGNYAFVGCDPNCNYLFSAPEREISRCGRGGSCDKKKKGGSSNKDEGYDPVFHAISVGNIDIKTAYLGISPNIIVNLNFFVDAMKKARKLFGHIVPPPDFVHSAIWVGDSDSDESVGAVFYYGKYYNKYNDSSYISGDGARSYAISLKDFKDKYQSEILKLSTNKEIKLFDFIEKLKSGGKLTASEYNWPNNNCQHFTARCLKILHAKRQIPNENDWISLPKPIMNTLQTNEKDEE